ncbi:GNAT family N-acetyltransferase [Candidatus Chloroploca sp. M-50]|uniref:GNAT family N-acetyltransferase n=1 Tax=Candidatus Chloroploca mongolica TaxID=2528176 RepID=A0ABS4DC76_9CHLR|nr:GNAT family N-acetyltransferase [Candidatus Chloroploca mongolica]MBP1467044.1 GNAT family N-acetyltransferase [Candidatus Chloroploca mongolica]
MSLRSPAKHESALTIRPVARATWDQFVAEHPDALLFHTSAWLDLLARVYGHTWHPLGIWASGELVGVIPIQRRRLGPFVLAGSPLMQTIASTPFLGPLGRPGQAATIVAALEPWFRQQRIAHSELAFPQMIEATAALKHLGYQSEVCETIVVPLAGRSRAEVWQSLSPACRRAVRKAEANGIEIVEAESNAFLQPYNQMCQEVYRHAGRPPHLDLNFYVALWQALHPRGNLNVLLAYHQGHPIAGGIFVTDQRTIWYLSGASFDQGQPLRPNNLLHWHVITWALAQGYQRYDMGGAVVPGITRFKLSFGGQRHPYTRIYRAHTPLARLGRTIYQQAIPWWRRFLHTRQKG